MKDKTYICLGKWVVFNGISESPVVHFACCPRLSLEKRCEPQSLCRQFQRAGAEEKVRGT